MQKNECYIFWVELIYRFGNRGEAPFGEFTAQTYYTYLLYCKDY